MGKPHSAIRSASLAGSWYPDSREECEALFETYEQDAVETTRGSLAAAVVPHAGWLFSGSIAYNALRELSRRAGPVDTVALFAGHLSPGAPLSLMMSGDYWTPLGPMGTDEEMTRQLGRRFVLSEESPNTHSQDNSAEVHFPLLKHFFADARLLVIGAPPRPEVRDFADGVVEAAERLNRRMVAIGSTDLTHYGPNYRFTPQGLGRPANEWVRQVNDPLFIEAACSGTPAQVIDTAHKNRNACCPGAVAAAMRCAAHGGSPTGQWLRYATSADVHPGTSFVGYAGIVY